MENPLSTTGWAIWIGRTAAAWAGCSVIAFYVSDYVSEARTQGHDTALQAVNTTIGTSVGALTANIEILQSLTRDTNNKVDELVEKLGGLSTLTAVNSERIARLQADLKNTQASIKQTSAEIETVLKDSVQLYVDASANTIKRSLKNVRVVPITERPEGKQSLQYKVDGQKRVWSPSYQLELNQFLNNKAFE